MLTSNDKGNIAESAIALEAMRLGVEVLKPVGEHVRDDLAFDLGPQILRVQCKWARLAGAVVCAHLVGFRQTTKGPVRSTYSADEIDAVALYCDDLRQVYLLPADLVDGQCAVQLRLSAPKNAQRAAINWGSNICSLGL